MYGGVRRGRGGVIEIGREGEGEGEREGGGEI